MEPDGIEPPRDAEGGPRNKVPSASPLPLARNTNLFGGAGRDRTDDLKLAKLALSQLSYGPGWWAWVDLNYRPHAYQACALTT